MLTGHRRGHEPLPLRVSAPGHHPRRRMAPLEPLQPQPLPFQVDAATVRVPLHEPTADAESQPAQPVAPRQVAPTPRRQLHDRLGDRIVSERVLRREQRPVTVRAVHAPKTPSYGHARKPATDTPGNLPANLQPSHVRPRVQATRPDWARHGRNLARQLRGEGEAGGTTGDGGGRRGTAGDSSAPQVAPEESDRRRRLEARQLQVVPGVDVQRLLRRRESIAQGEAALAR